MEEIFDKVGGWLEGNVLTSLIAGVVSFIAMVIIGVPYPAALAIWVAITDLVPMIGALIGALVCVIVAFFEGIGTGIATLVFFVIYQQLENLVIQPRMMKRTVDLSATTVILAALIGAALLGPLGVLLGVPGAAALKILLTEVLAPRADLETASEHSPVVEEASLPADAPVSGAAE
jgi:predicted PurR-regulated permease PerM